MNIIFVGYMQCVNFYYSFTCMIVNYHILILLMSHNMICTLHICLCLDSGLYTGTGNPP